MKKRDNILNPAFGLFSHKGKSFYKNLIDIKIYLERVHFLLKRGYSPVAQWETHTWFTCWVDEILKEYLDNRTGTFVKNPYNGNELKLGEEKMVWDDYLIEMRDCLKVMEKLEHEPFKFIELYKTKEKFFKMFSNIFYSLWD